MRIPATPDLCPLVFFLAAGYGAALTGCGIAHLARILFRRGDTGGMNSAEVFACIRLPVLTLIIFFLVGYSREYVDTFGLKELHDGWHILAGWLNRTPFVHGLLHVLNVALILGAVCTMANTVYGLTRTQTFASTLHHLATKRRSPEGTPAHILPTGGVYCFTVGIRCPQIYISEGLLAKLSPRKIGTILAHEKEHIRRRDGLISMALTVLTRLLPLPGGLFLLAEWNTAAECACDEAAVPHAGSRYDVATTLVNVAASVREQPENQGVLPAMCFANEADQGRELQQRIQTLLGESTLTSPFQRIRVLVIYVLAGGFTVVLYPFLTHLAELFGYHSPYAVAI